MESSVFARQLDGQYHSTVKVSPGLHYGDDNDGDKDNNKDSDDEKCNEL